MRRYSGGDGGDVEEAQHARLVDCARVFWAAMDTSHAPESFRGLLLRHRGRTGLTQRDFATRAGVSRNSVQDWESGASHPGADLKVARMSSSDLRPDRWVLNFHYLVGTPQGVEHFTEQHHLGLFTTEDYVNAFADAGLHVNYDPDGISGRGLVIGVKPSA